MTTERRQGTPTDDLSFEELLNAEAKPRKKISQGDKIDAEIISIGRTHAFLDLGARSEGVIDRALLTNADGEVTAQPGDRIAVFVTGFRDGATVCARRLSVGHAERSDDKSATLKVLRDAFNAHIPVEGTVQETNKGGFTISMMGLRAFCPVSQIDNKYCETPEVFVGQSLLFEVTKLEDERNIVVSRRRLLEAEAEEKSKELWSQFAEGQIYDGVVSSLRPFGAFVDIGGVDGLIHVSELSHQRVADPAELLTVGQIVKVAIKNLDPVKRRVGLSLKALMADPWEEITALVQPGQVVKGRVVRLTKFGAFVEIVPGIEGLLHISEIGGEERIRSPKDVLKEDQEIEVRIREIDVEAHRISLGTTANDDKEEWREHVPAAPSRSSMGTFGDLLKSKLSK